MAGELPYLAIPPAWAETLVLCISRVIGKSLESLDEGTAVIQMLVMLQ
jgi:hypothetical protein